MDSMVHFEGTSSDLMEILKKMADATDRIATALESQEKEKQSPEISKEALAIGLLFSMEKPTKRKIAEQVGYANHTCLNTCRSFTKAWDAFQISKGFQSGSIGPSGQRRNGREMGLDYDGTED